MADNPQVRLDIAPSYETPRPKTRGDCIDGSRPCPWATCRYHLASDIDRRGHLHVSPTDSGETCALDVVDRHGNITLREVARLLGITHQGARFIETRALADLGRGFRRLGLDASSLAFEREEAMPPPRPPVTGVRRAGMPRNGAGPVRLRREPSLLEGRHEAAFAPIQLKADAQQTGCGT